MATSKKNVTVVVPRPRAGRGRRGAVVGRGTRPRNGTGPRSNTNLCPYVDNR